MNDVTVHEEVRVGADDRWQLCFQWCTYTFDDGSSDLEGYRFIWRRPDGSLQAARGQARIPSIADLHELLYLAARAGWLRSVEGRSAHLEMVGRPD